VSDGGKKRTRTFESVLERVVEHREHVVLGPLVRYRVLAVPLTAGELEEVAARIDRWIRRLQNARR